MPDHLHLFVATDDQRITLSTWMKSLKNTLSKPLRFSGVASPHWEKTFFDHALRSGESYSKNGTTLETIRCGQAWFGERKIGRLQASYLNFFISAEFSAVIDRR